MVVVQHCPQPNLLPFPACTAAALQERLDAKSREYAAERAKVAESEIIRMEVSCVVSRQRKPFLQLKSYYGAADEP